MLRLHHSLVTLGVLMGLAGSVQAQNVQAQMTFQQVSALQSQGKQGPVPLLHLSPTWGLTLSFIPTGERVQQVSVGDPSRVLVDFDSPLSEGGQRSTGGGASVIYLRELGQPLDLNLRLTPAARHTNQMPLTVVTMGPRGRQLYQFRLLVGQATSVSTVEVVPESMMPSAQTLPQPLPQLVRGQPGVAPLPPLGSGRAKATGSGGSRSRSFIPGGQ